MKLTRHGSFDESLENKIREDLLAEFTEGGSDAMDFAACQRPDGSIYGIPDGKQCKKGKKVQPSQKIDREFLKGRSTQKLKAYLDNRKLYPYQRRAIEAELAKRAAPQTGMTAAVRSLARQPGTAGVRGREALQAKLKARAKAKLVEKDVEQAKAKAERAKAKRQGKPAPEVPKAAKKGGLAERMAAAYDKKVSEKKSSAKAAKKPVGKPAKAAQEKPSMQINKRFLQREPTQKLEQYLKDRKLYAYQRKAIEAELAKRAKGGQGVPAKKPAGGQVGQAIARRDAALADAKARKAAIANIDKQIAQIAKRRQEPAYQQTANKKFLDSVEKGLVRRRLGILEGKLPVSAEAVKTKAKSGEGTVASAKPRQVNQKFLRQPDRILQAALRRGDLNPIQRRKIEEELGGRGVTPAKAVGVPTRNLDAVRKAGWNVEQGVKGYDPLAVYGRKDNELLASGAFGAAYRTKGPPPGVIKQGKIGEHEAEVWQKLQGTGRVPEFHGAAVSPNMKIVGPGYGGHVKEGNGYLGIGEAKGVPVGKLNPRSAAERNQILEEYIRTRRDMHLAGVAHNDMHANNVFYDRATGKMQAIDFGLAQPSYKAALMEALTTNQGDWQSERFIGRYKSTGGGAPAYYKFRRNQSSVLRSMDDNGIDTRRIMNMGIRNKPEYIDRVLKGMSEAAAKGYLKALYNGV